MPFTKKKSLTFGRVMMTASLVKMKIYMYIHIAEVPILIILLSYIIFGI